MNGREAETAEMRCYTRNESVVMMYTITIKQPRSNWVRARRSWKQSRVGVWGWVRVMIRVYVRVGVRARDGEGQR